MQQTPCLEDVWLCHCSSENLSSPLTSPHHSSQPQCYRLFLFLCCAVLSCSVFHVSDLLPNPPILPWLCQHSLLIHWFWSLPWLLSLALHSQVSSLARRRHRKKQGCLLPSTTVSLVFLFQYAWLYTSQNSNINSSCPENGCLYRAFCGCKSWARSW